MILHIEVVVHNLRDVDRVPGLVAARPCGVKLAHKIFALSCEFILERQPSHVKDHEPAVFLQDAGELGRDLFVIKIPEALARGDHVKALAGEVDLLG